MKEKIYNYICAHPNCRQRDIASSIGVWLCAKAFLDALHELAQEGKIISSVYSDPANMENYLMWRKNLC